MKGAYLSWHKLVVKFDSTPSKNWYDIKPWLDKHCEGKYFFSANIIKFELESDRLLFQLGFKNERS